MIVYERGQNEGEHLTEEEYKQKYRRKSMNHVEIDIFKGGAKSLSGLKKDLEKLNISINLKEHDRGYSCSLDWLIPTGIIFTFLKPYFETFLKKAAEDHYKILKQICTELYRIAIKPKEEPKIIREDGSVKETIFTMHFSVIHRITKNEKSITLKLMFPKSCTSDYFEKSITSFVDLLSYLEDTTHSEDFFNKLIKFGTHGTEVLWYNKSKKTLEFLDIVKSSKAKSIVAKH